MNIKLFSHGYHTTVVCRIVHKFALYGVKLPAHTQFGPETALARHSLRPGNTSAWNTLARNTLAQKYFGPKQLRPGNTSAHLYTSARKYFGPLHFGPGTKLSKVSFFIIFDLPYA